MAHFAKLGVNGKVIAVHGLDNDQMLNADGQEDETVGQQRLEQIHGWPAQMWIQTSYNTRGGKYYVVNDAGDTVEGDDQSKAFRGNYAGIGSIWDEDNNIFIGVQPHASWTKNVSTASWVAPITYPSVTNDGQDPVVWEYEISWNETLYQSDNSKGWEAWKSNDSAETKTMFDWNGSAWVGR